MSEIDFEVEDEKLQVFGGKLKTIMSDKEKFFKVSGRHNNEKNVSEIMDCIELLLIESWSSNY